MPIGKKEDLLQRNFNKKRKERVLDANKKIGKRDQIQINFKADFINEILSRG